MTTYIDARITEELAQRVFDVLLRTISEPGKVLSLPNEVISKSLPLNLWLPLVLSDVDTTVHIGTSDIDHQRLVFDASGAIPKALTEADIVVLDQSNSERISNVRTGTALAPELGAKVALNVTRFNAQTDNSENSVSLQFQGPGINGSRDIQITGMSLNVLNKLGTNSGPYPQGFDTWLFSEDGLVISIPRTTRITSKNGDN